MFSRRMGVVVVCQDDGLDGERLPPEVELTIYRLVQETLTNAVRHGRATRMTALIERQPAGVRAIVQDNGSGFDPQDWRKHCATGNHLGLMGIEERVMLLGGVLEIESTHSCGTRVIADIPIKPEAAA
jgi:signal transduction histidine kinase